jgi:hypothetical protein
MPRTTTCTAHCSACGLHFHSLKAFDAHRVGEYRSNDPEEDRRCVHPLDMGGRLVPLIVGGECRVHDDGSGQLVKRDVTIWTDARDLARAQDAAERSGWARRGAPRGLEGSGVGLLGSEALSVHPVLSGTAGAR